MLSKREEIKQWAEKFAEDGLEQGVPPEELSGHVRHKLREKFGDVSILLLLLPLILRIVAFVIERWQRGEDD